MRSIPEAAGHHLASPCGMLELSGLLWGGVVEAWGLRRGQSIGPSADLSECSSSHASEQGLNTMIRAFIYLKGMPFFESGRIVSQSPSPSMVLTRSNRPSIRREC